ncbi:MAG: hypothetical protein ACK4U0_13700 [Mesorhizobium sp.]
MNGPAFVADFFVLGAAKRIMSISSGFRALMSVRNFTCAAALLRLQIDTAARLNALRYVESVDDLCRSLMTGTRFDRHRDRNGKPLKDGYLISKLSEIAPWVAEVYRETSGFVHLSDRHIFSTMSDAKDETRSVKLTISANDPERPDHQYLEIIDAFAEATILAGSLVEKYADARSAVKEG